MTNGSDTLAPDHFGVREDDGDKILGFVVNLNRRICLRRCYLTSATQKRCDINAKKQADHEDDYLSGTAHSGTRHPAGCLCDVLSSACGLRLIRAFQNQFLTVPRSMRFERGTDPDFQSLRQ